MDYIFSHICASPFTLLCVLAGADRYQRQQNKSHETLHIFCQRQEILLGGVELALARAVLGAQFHENSNTYVHMFPVEPPSNGGSNFIFGSAVCACQKARSGGCKTQSLEKRGRAYPQEQVRELR